VQETLSLINQIIDEHRYIADSAQASEKMVNDIAAVLELGKGVEKVVPGRLDDQKKKMQELQVSLERFEARLHGHFEREESALLAAFEDRGGKALASALHVLLDEHQELKDRVARLRKSIADLLEGGFSRDVLEGKAHGMRAYMHHTRKLLEAHAKSEMELLQAMRKLLQR